MLGATLVLLQGCTVVFHTASPFVLSAGYGAAAQKNLIDPAVKGTENVLSEC
jgi:dihydroflavonol-4-reductase